MSTSAAVHTVHFYDAHEVLIERLRGLVSYGFDVGNAALIVATPDHRRQLVDALEQNGVDVKTAIQQERFVLCDAEETLCHFMVGGHPDPVLFIASMRNLLVSARKTAPSQDQGLIVFGEMVALLWAAGNQDGALALERLWNALLNERPFHLHCAYPRSLFSHDEHGMLHVCKNHLFSVGACMPN